MTELGKYLVTKDSTGHQLHHCKTQKLLYIDKYASVRLILRGPYSVAWDKTKFPNSEMEIEDTQCQFTMQCRTSGINPSHA